jgi:hypothetical protein
MSEIFFTKTAFHFQGLSAIEIFLNLTPPHWQNYICNIKISWTPRLPLYFPDFSIDPQRPGHIFHPNTIASARETEKTWESICTSLTEISSLRELRIIFFPEYLWISERGLLSPLLGLTTLDTFTVQVPWHLAKEGFGDEVVVPWELRRPLDEYQNLSRIWNYDYRVRRRDLVLSPHRFVGYVWDLGAEAWKDWRKRGG